jgi:hypothetical protein
LFFAFCIKKDKTRYYAPSCPAALKAAGSRIGRRSKDSSRQIQLRPSDIIA